MNLEQLLKKLEANCLLRQIEVTPPPALSNFYWKNNHGDKYKVFIDTPDRFIYYNLEEYDRFMTIKEIDGYGWKFVKKCVLLAVSDIYTEDQPFIKQIEFLIANSAEWKNNATVNSEEANESGTHDKNMNIRHFRLTKYFVNDIIKCPKEKRGLFAKFSDILTIWPENVNAKIMDENMNIAFELAAKRFANDVNHRGFSYYSH
ncbi:uncharacterized protein LOC112598195 [Melanaphis sacchari]|uniref:uncharacterized protein LOC112598195 n=1 Tax=Melanaphis sacchari TaxID=742174 RepID=UPI000DC13D26|nr:uncharacterized protein LOC112598195 [Melanaphis sacchari]